MADKTIVRVEKNRENPYVMINKNIFTDERVSWKAKGLMGYFLSRPDDWLILVSDLIKQSTDGERAVRSGLKELEEFGYLENHPIKDRRGRIIRWEKVVHECPIETPKLPHVQNSNQEQSPDRRFVHVENADVENVHVENAGLLNTDTTNKKGIQNIDNNNIVAVGQKIEALLNTPIHSIYKVLPRWIKDYGEQRLIDLAEYIGSKPNGYWDDPIAAYRTGVEEVWDIKQQLAVTDMNPPITQGKKERDPRYEEFYKIFPNI